MVTNHHSDMTSIGLEQVVLSISAIYIYIYIYIYLINIPCKELSEHKFPVDTEGIFIEISLRKTKLLILGSHRPLINQLTIYFENVVKALDIYSQKNDKFILCGDLNSEHTESSLSKFLVKYGWKNLF